MTDTFYRMVTPLVEVFEDLNIAYYIGGSVASVTYGMPRSTMDVDVVADIRRAQISQLITRLQPLGYVEREAVQTE